MSYTPDPKLILADAKMMDLIWMRTEALPNEAYMLKSRASVLRKDEEESTC
jgi:hypothetical protein